MLDNNSLSLVTHVRVTLVQCMFILCLCFICIHMS